ncbi:hypothetical protein [Lysobacter sp. M15]|jgi:hypothetical protein|uniref:hypothetical protein n=1 Tax=Lysobacter sp. M15 TaxID=2916837 RepID=UPI001F588CF5|nr:hypothetical protein [Lysobacter sp. M15]
MHTKNGKPLQVSGSTLYSAAGQVVGRMREDKLFGLNGRYVGTVVGDRLVYRSSDSARVAPGFASARCAPRSLPSRPRSAVRGDEPVIPE